MFLLPISFNAVDIKSVILVVFYTEILYKSLSVLSCRCEFVETQNNELFLVIILN